MRARTAFFWVLVLLLVTRAPMLWETYLHSDEALFALSAKLWKLGGQPYVAWFETKPLGVYLFYSIGGIQAVHLLAMVWTLLTAWVLYRIGLKIGDTEELRRRNAGLAAIFYIAFSTFWDPTIVAVSIEVVLLLPLGLCILLLPAAAEPPSLSRHFFSGMATSAAFLCKYQAGILLPVVFLYYGWILPRSSETWNLRRTISSALLFALGFLPFPLLMIAYLVHVGSWEGFVFWNVLGNAHYINDGNAAVQLSHKIATQVCRYLPSTGLLWFLVGDRLLDFWKNRKRSEPSSTPYEKLLWIWLTLSFIPVSVGKRFEDHYFLFLTPAASVLAAMSLGSWSPQRLRRWAWAVFLWFLIPTAGFSVTRYFMHDLNRQMDGEDMNDYRPYGNFLKNRTRPGDSVFIWGCAPAIYLYADRRPATRFLRTDVLAGRVPGFEPKAGEPFDASRFVLPGTWDMLFEDMDRNPPAYVMDTAPTGLHDFRPYPMENYPRLMAFIQKNYVKEPPFRNAAVYRRKDLPPAPADRVSEDSSGAH